MAETYEKAGDDLAVTVTVDERTLLAELARQEAKKAQAEAKIVILEDKLAVINA
jgi:hypothetical protein